MKAILCIVVYLVLVFVLGLVMALPESRAASRTDNGDDDY